MMRKDLLKFLGLILILILVMSVVFTPFEKVKGYENALPHTIRVWVDRGCGSTYMVGERGSVYVQLDWSGYVEVTWSCNYGPERRIFAGNLSPGTHRVFSFTIVEPTGTEIVTARLYGSCGAVVAQDVCIFYSESLPCHVQIWTNKGCNKTFELGEYIEIYGKSTVEAYGVYVVQRPDGIWRFNVHLPANRVVVLAKGVLEGPTGTRKYTLCVYCSPEPPEPGWENFDLIDIPETVVCDSCTIYVKAGKGCFSGYVRDKNGNPVPDAEVKITSGPVKRTGKTDSNGFYKICELPPGEYSAIAEKECLKSEKKTGITVESGKTTEGIDFIVEDIGGEVFVSPQQWEPTLKGGEIKNMNFTIKTDECPSEIANIHKISGPEWLKIKNLPSLPLRIEKDNPLEFSIEVSPPISVYGDFPFSVEIEISKGNPSVLNIEGVIHVEISPGRIKGRVLDEDGNPVAGAVVSIVSGTIKKSTTTGSNGYYDLPDLVPGTYSVTVSKENYNSQTKSQIRIDPGQTLNLNFTLKFSEGEWDISPYEFDLIFEAGESDTKEFEIKVLSGKIKNLHIERSYPDWISFSIEQIESMKFGETKKIKIKLSPYRAVAGDFIFEIPIKVDYGKPKIRNLKLTIKVKPYIPPSNETIEEDLDNDGKKDVAVATDKNWMQINSSDKDAVVSKIGLTQNKKVVIEKIESKIQKQSLDELSLVEGPNIEVINDDYEFKAIKSESIYSNLSGTKRLKVIWTIITPTEEDFSYVMGKFENIGIEDIHFSSSTYFGASLIEAKIVNPEKLLIFGAKDEIDIEENPSGSGYELKKDKPIMITYNNEVAFGFGFLSPWITDPKGAYTENRNIVVGVDEITLKPDESSFWQGFMSVIDIQQEYYGKVFAGNYPGIRAITLQSFLKKYFEKMFKTAKEKLLDMLNKLATRITGFKDIEGRTDAGYIAILFEEGILKGYPTGEVKPDSQVTRAEFVTMICKFLRLRKYEGIDTTFPDVKINDWFYGYVETAVKYGLVKGYPDGTFKPNNPVSRSEAITVLANALDIFFDSPIQHFIDVPKAYWGYSAIEGAYLNHIIPIEPPIVVKNRFYPDKKAKRGELAIFICNGSIYNSER